MQGENSNGLGNLPKKINPPSNGWLEKKAPDRVTDVIDASQTGQVVIARDDHSGALSGAPGSGDASCLPPEEPGDTATPENDVLDSKPVEPAPKDKKGRTKAKKEDKGKKKTEAKKVRRPRGEAKAPPCYAEAKEVPRTEKMNGKPVLYRKNAKTVLNMESDFLHKLLSTGPVLNLGDACGFGCVYCSTPSVARKFVHGTLAGKAHAEVVVRRPNALELLEEQLAKLSEEQKAYPHVVFASSLVDIAANTELMRESAEAFTMILKAAPAWGIRTLTKSTLSRGLVEAIPEAYHRRILWGISIGILDDAVARVIEVGTPSPTRRFASLHWLQDNGQRTYAMPCPALPMASPEEYRAYAEKCRDLYRYDRCEDVFAEPINGRDDNFSKTVEAAAKGGFPELAWQLGLVGGKTEEARRKWEDYARILFEEHARVIPPEKLRYLQYVERKVNVEYWKAQKDRGAVLLGRYGHDTKTEPVVKDTPIPVVEGTEEIRDLLETNRGIEVKLKRKAMTLMATWVPNVIKIGKFFSAQKDTLPHGQYLNWLTTNFKIDRKTAGNYVAVYTQRERVLEAIKCGTVPHLKAAYDLARKANRALKEPPKGENLSEEATDEQPNLLQTDSDLPEVEEVCNVVEESDKDADIAPTFEIVDAASPILVAEVPEEVMAEMLEVAKKHGCKIVHQIIREDGEIRLNDYFAKRLALRAD